MLQPQFKVNTSKLSEAIGMAEEWSSRSPRKICSDAARGISFKAFSNTKAVATNRVDFELRVVVTPGLTKAGNPSKSKKNELQLGGMSPIQKSQTDTLARLILFARMHPSSRFNTLTNQRFAISGGTSILGGLGKGGRDDLMEAMQSQMIKARKSSSGFLKAGWAEVTQKLRRLHWGSYSFAENVDFSIEHTKDEFGSVTANIGPSSASITISNNIGTKAGKDGDNSANYNKALLAIGGPPLQRAVDEQAADIEAHYLPKVAADLEKSWNAI